MKKEAIKKGLKDYRFYFIIFSIAVLLIISVKLILPFISSIIGSMILAYIFHPVYKFILARVKYKSISSALTILIIIIIVAVPLFFIIRAVTYDAYSVYTSIQSFDTKTLTNCTDSNNVLCNLANSLKESSRGILSIPEISITMKDTAGFIISKMTKFAVYIVTLIFHAFIILFMTYYLLKDGDKIVNSIYSSIPIHKRHKSRIIERISEVTYGTIYGAIIIAVVQGILATIGFYIFSVPSPLFWGVVVTLFCLIPVLGSGIVWAPAAAIHIINGSTQSNPSLVWKGIGLALYGLLVVSTADNLIRPKVMGERARTHPIIILLGVFGGIALFGMIGFIIGPVILSLLITVIEILNEENVKE